MLQGVLLARVVPLHTVALVAGQITGGRRSIRCTAGSARRKYAMCFMRYCAMLMLMRICYRQLYCKKLDLEVARELSWMYYVSFQC
jgi:hypothetical protein